MHRQGWAVSGSDGLSPAVIVSWIVYLLGSMTVRRTTDYESIMNTAHSNILILELILKTNTGVLT